MSGSTPPAENNGDNTAQLADMLRERYLSYALSTIVSRALPDVRDGLKPVHRRILYAMQQGGFRSDRPYNKSARIVGDVMGKYHPHGDQSIYDALVRMAQDFSMRLPMIDGQGNFGSIDPDPAAAARYTEARMTPAAEAMLEGIDEDAVDFQPNYDGKTEEPSVLPAALPNLLANGSSGIAVGMATNIPPHNIKEICAALLHLIKHPDAGIETLLSHMPGPDFPTGGELVESRATILEAYRTGRGGLRVRARWEIEKLKGGTWQAVVTEIPYQVHKGKLIERIADLLLNRKLPMLVDVRDESAEDLRLVLEPRSRNVDPAMLMESLFHHTDLETRFGLNMNVLDAGQTPRVMNLREVLRAFLDHRHTVLQRRTAHRLAQVERRLEILDGYLIAYLNLDEVIRIVRQEDEPKDALIAAFDLTALQADEILNMRLRALHKLEELEIREKHAALKSERNSLKALLADEPGRWKAVAGEITDIRNRFGKDKVLGPRRTLIGEPPKSLAVPLEAMIEREPVTILCSEHGWIRALRGHLAEDSDLKYKEGDSHRFHLHAETTDKLLIFGTNGRFYTLGADKLPGGRGFGEPLNLMIDLGSGHDVVAVMVHKPDRTLLVAARDGRGFLVREADVIAQTRAGKQILNVSGDVEAKFCIPADGDHVAVIGDNRKLLIFDIKETPTMARGRGVILQRYKDGGLSDARVFRLADGLTWKHGGGTRTETKLDGWLGKRAQAGRLPPAGFPRDNKFG